MSLPRQTGLSAFVLLLTCTGAHALDTSLGRINGDDVHAMGHTGFTADVAILDTGVGILNTSGFNHTALTTGPSIITRMDFSGSGTANDAGTTNGGHGTHVAGIVASGDSMFKGVAPAADLLGAKIFSNAGGGSDTFTFNGMEWALAQGADVMNLSIGGRQTTSNGTADQLQKYIDFLIDNPTRGGNNDTMNEPVTVAIAAGNGSNFNPGGGAITTTSVESPGSAYNAITVGATTNNFLNATNWTSRRGVMGKGPDGQWGIAGFDDDGDGTVDNIEDFGGPGSDDTFNTGGGGLRSKPDLVAPGTNIMSTNNDWGEVDNGIFGTAGEGDNDGDSSDGDDDTFDFVQLTGTSMATPHVAGSAGILFDIGNQNDLTQAGTPLTAAFDHKVIKSVLLTGTDKMAQAPTTAGVTRDDNGSAWTRASSFQPLDDTLGAGQLDVLNAVKVYKDGEENPSNISTNLVDELGWDIHAISTTGDAGRRLYTFEDKLYAGSWLTASLVWDRHVTWTDDGDGNVEFTDTFAYTTLDDLDLKLYDGQFNSLGSIQHSSLSIIDNVEHLHFQIPETDFYTLSVRLVSGNGEVYGVSWATVFIPEPTTGLLMLFSAAWLGLTRSVRRRHVGSRE